MPKLYSSVAEALTAPIDVAGHRGLAYTSHGTKKHSTLYPQPSWNGI